MLMEENDGNNEELKKTTFGVFDQSHEPTNDN